MEWLWRLCWLWPASLAAAAEKTSATRSIADALPTDARFDLLDAKDAARCRQPKLTGTCRAALPRFSRDLVSFKAPGRKVSSQVVL